MLRNWLVAALFLAAVGPIVCAQGKWKHEVLIDRSEVEPNGNYVVNRQGIPTYTVKMNVPGASVKLLQAFKYKTNYTQLYFPGPSQGVAQAINDAGQFAWIALDSKSLHSMVEGHDYFADVYPPTLWPAADIGIRGITGDGRPSWGYVTNDDYTKLYLGSQPIYAEHKLSEVNGFFSQCNRRGDVSFQAASALTGGILDVFHKGINYSASILGDNRSTSAQLSMNDQGDLLWTGWSTATGGEPVVYLNDRVIGVSQYRDGPAAQAVKLTNSGHVAWLSMTRGRAFVQLDGRDLSQVDGYANRYEVAPAYIKLSESGHIAWLGLDVTDAGRRALVKDQTDISTPLVGVQDPLHEFLYLKGISDSGQVLWSGTGEKTDHLPHVFVDSYDLTADFGVDPSMLASTAGAIGPNGEVLWIMAYPDRKFSYILSTPVPEPSQALLLVLGAGAVVWRRGRGDRSPRSPSSPG